ncbi:MAG: hypothetical protein K8H89_08385 [Flavobacteriales bacterium]|jgi:hypothetical protein|nr:hypothetical protein [Flavobacteriales bacterium]MCB0756906.1 hypothetical protein [Flavobacteriales bacterium]
MGEAGPVRPDGSLSEAAIVLLHAVSGVDVALLSTARIRPARANWLHAPWYGFHRGGAIAVGRTIWFTRIWFDPRNHGDGSLPSCRKWLVHLAHEVGHLPQAERYGMSFLGKARYIAAFAWQYGTRAMLMRKDIHDGSPLEREADRGRAVLLQLLGDEAEQPAIVAAVQRGDEATVRAWCAERNEQIAMLWAGYVKENLA